MKVFELDKLLCDDQFTQKAYFEFLHGASLSMGIYRLKAGQEDRQQPHTEDEVYYVLEGNDWFRSGDEELAVDTGNIIFVERFAAHLFYDITKDLSVLVFFAPAEGSLRGKT